MTETPIVAPPDWRPAPPARETIAAGVVRSCKEDIWNANELIRFWAGRNDKPKMKQDAAVAAVKAAAQGIPKLRQANRIQNQTVTDFKAFFDTWNGGDGSWTKCKPMIGNINQQMMNIIP